MRYLLTLCLLAVLAPMSTVADQHDGRCVVLEPTGDRTQDWSNQEWLDPSCVHYTIEVRYKRFNKDEAGEWHEFVLMSQQWNYQSYPTFAVAGWAIAQVTGGIFAGWANGAAAANASMGAAIEALRGEVLTQPEP